jgi:hypothetical protein
MLASLFDLKSSVALWERVEFVAAAVVILGVLGEVASEFMGHEAKTPAKRPVSSRVARLSGLILIGGLALELQAIMRVSGLYGQITAELERKAGEANKAAGDAIGTAAQANERAADANERASRAVRALASANEKSARANERAAKAERESARLNQIAEDERLARVKIEERIRPRRLSPQQREAIRVALSRHSGARVRISTIADDAESGNLGADIKDAVSLAGWQLAFFGPVSYLGSGRLPSGVEIWVGDMFNTPAVALLRALRDHGIDVAIRLEEAEKSGDVIVVVGSKP